MQTRAMKRKLLLQSEEKERTSKKSKSSRMNKPESSVRIQRWWRKIKRDAPVNSCDALTLEAIDGPRPEEGGEWFDIVTDKGHRVRYSAEHLFGYLVSQYTNIEPLHRQPLNMVELRRLDRLIKSPVRREYGGKYAANLLNTETKLQRTQEDQDREIMFFL